jgi:phosphoglycerol transferase MdoB-like AlkP superfamily enzyme
VKIAPDLLIPRRPFGGGTLGWLKEVVRDPLPLLLVLAVVGKTLVLFSIVASAGESFHLIIPRLYGARLEAYWAFAVLFAAPALLFGGGKRVVYCFAVDVLISAVLLTDALHFRSFGAIATVHDLAEIGDLHGVEGNVAGLLRPIDLCFAVDFPVLAALVLWRRKKIPALRPLRLGFALASLVALGYIGWLHWDVDLRRPNEQTSFLRVLFLPVPTLARLSPIGFHVYDAVTFFREQRVRDLKPEEQKAIESWFDDKREPQAQEPVPTAALKGAFKGKNLLVIQVESLERFPIGHSVSGQEVTPSLNALLPEALFFTDIHEQINGGGSSDSDFMLNTSIYPVRRGTVFHRFPRNHYASLPLLLGQHGYSTVVAHPVRAAFWNWKEALTYIGFDRCLDETAFQLDSLIGLGLSDESFLRQVRPVIAGLKRPFYAFVVTVSTHQPFEWPPELSTLKLDPELAKARMGGYLQAMHYVDEHLGRLLRGLAEDGVLEDTVVVVVGDHGGMHRFYSLEIRMQRPQEDWWQDTSSHIPFLIWSKGLAGQELKVKGGQVDMMPTLLWLLGVEDEAWERTAMGRNLLTTHESFAVLSSGEFKGGPQSRRDPAVRGLEIADWIITSRYFERYRPVAPTR